MWAVTDVGRAGCRGLEGLLGCGLGAGVEKTNQAGREAERLTGHGWREGGRLG